MVNILLFCFMIKGNCISFILEVLILEIVLTRNYFEYEDKNFRVFKFFGYYKILMKMFFF